MFLNSLYSTFVSSLCMHFFATICEGIIPWISVVQSMKKLGTKCRFSKSLKHNMQRKKESLSQVV